MSNNEFVKIVNSLSPTVTTEIVKPKEVWNIDERCFRNYSDLIGDHKEFSEMDPDIPAKAKWEISEAFEIFLEFQKEMKEKIVKHNKQNTRKALLSIFGLIISINSLIYTKLHSESILKTTELLFIFASIFCSFFFATYFYKFVSRKKDIGIVEKFLEEAKIQEKKFHAGQRHLFIKDDIESYIKSDLFIPYRQQSGVFDYNKFDDRDLVERELICRLRENHDKIFYNKIRVEDYPIEDFFRFVENPETGIEELDKYAAKKKEA